MRNQNPEDTANRYIDIYLSEIYAACKSIKDKSDRIFGSVGPEFCGIISEMDFVYDAAYIAADAARVFNLISGGPDEKKSGERSVNYKIRLERRRILREFFFDVDWIILRGGAVRNALEHTDEYIDEVLANYLINKPKYIFSVHNMALSSKDLFKINDGGVWGSIRVVFIKEKILEHCGKALDLGKVYDVALNIIQKMEELKIGEGGYIRRIEQRDNTC